MIRESGVEPNSGAPVVGKMRKMIGEDLYTMLRQKAKTGQAVAALTPPRRKEPAPSGGSMAPDN